MMSTSLVLLFERDLNKLITEIELYHNESSLWIINKGIANSAGNLCLHLAGNLQHFIGNILGGTNYTRNREAEFSSKNIPRKVLIEQVHQTMAVIASVLPSLTQEDLEKDFPVEVFGYKMSTEYFLIHLAMHLDYHLGQINYHRRLLDEFISK